MIFFYIPVVLNDYSWFKFYNGSDSLWLDDSINWDSVSDLAWGDLLLANMWVMPTFISTHIFLDSWQKHSFLDVWLQEEVQAELRGTSFREVFFWDLVQTFQINFFFLQFLFFTDFQNLLTLLLHHAPELLLALLDYFTFHWWRNFYVTSPSAGFDSFYDALSSHHVELYTYFVAFFVFAWLTVFLFSVFILATWSTHGEAFLVRFYYYLFTASRELRLQFEAVVKVIFFFLLYFSAMVATFDDDQEELLEGFHLFSFYMFLGVFAFLVYRYSLHYFSFLQATEAKSRLVGMLAQFLHDMANTFALSLRFIVLMIRLNMYDFLDDVFDSYYIFLCDFDDDEYFVDLFYSFFTLLFFDSDNNDDRSVFLEDEVDFSLDLFSLYFIVWSKFSLFFIFAGDEVARVFLAFYLVYLIIFEMQAVNRSFVEDLYLTTKRQQEARIGGTNRL